MFTLYSWKSQHLSAVRTALFKYLTAHRTELRTDRIAHLAIRQTQLAPVDDIRLVRGTGRIRTKSPLDKIEGCWVESLEIKRTRCRPAGALLPQLNAHFLCQLADNLVIQLRPVALLEHRKRRLLAADFSRNLTLRKLRHATRVTDLSADVWIQVCHGRVLWTLFLSTSRGDL